MTHIKSNITALNLAVLLAAGTLAVGCGQTVQGAKQDTANIAEKVAGAAETVDVKSALIADKRVDTSDVNVDTNTSTNTVVLKGSVPTSEQRSIAEQIAREQAKGYRIVNQLSVKAAG